MSATLAMATDAIRPDGSLAFLAFPASRAEEQVTPPAFKAIEGITVLLRQLISEMIACRTSAEFEAASSHLFPQYVRMMMGLSSIVTAIVPAPVVDRLTWEALSEMESDFRHEGVAAFGEEMKEQAMFTVWTLRKINELSRQLELAKAPVAEEFKAVDAENARRFALNVLVARFHLDCLNLSLREKRPLYPEIVESASEGLRSLVNAYAHIRQGVRMRLQTVEQEPISIVIDDEDQELLAFSMEDLARGA